MGTPETGATLMPEHQYSADNPFAAAAQAAGGYSADNPFAPTPDRLAEIRARKAALEAQMKADRADDAAFFANQAATGRMSPAMAATLASPAVTEGVPVLAPSQPTPAPETPTQRAPEPSAGRSVVDYVLETAGNVPGSAENVLGDIWAAISDPVGTARAIGGGIVGGIQHGKEALGVPIHGTFGDWRPEAKAVADYYGTKYGSGDAILDSLRTDPVGTALDVGGVLTGGAGLGVRAPGVAGRIARTVAKADPGVVAGKVVESVTKGSSRLPSRKAFIEGAPSGESMRKRAGALYEAAEAAGVKFPQTEYATFVDDLTVRLAKEGADPVLSPKVVRLQKLLEDSRGQAPDLQRMETIRRQFLDAAGSADPAERRLAQIGVDAVDDFVENASESTAGTLKEARSLWRRMRKAEVIDDAIENATLAKEGVEAGLRNQFSSLYRQRKSKKMRGFSADELAAIKAVAEGTMTSNVLRRIGSLSGGTGAQRNMLNLLVGSGVGGGAGAAVGGPVGGAFGAAAVPIAGHIAQRAAQRRTQQAADLVRAMTARGTTPARSRVPRPVVRGAGRLAGQAPPVANPLAAILANTEEWR